jgi:hypothetical protein
VKFPARHVFLSQPRELPRQRSSCSHLRHMLPRLPRTYATDTGGAKEASEFNTGTRTDRDAKWGMSYVTVFLAPNPSILNLDDPWQSDPDHTCYWSVRLCPAPAAPPRSTTVPAENKVSNPRVTILLHPGIASARAFRLLLRLHTSVFWEDRRHGQGCARHVPRWHAGACVV